MQLAGSRFRPSKRHFYSHQNLFTLWSSSPSSSQVPKGLSFLKEGCRDLQKRNLPGQLIIQMVSKLQKTGMTFEKLPLNFCHIL